MAKELPYFQFEPAQYLTGNIQFCSYELQGVFINVCAFYWQRSCEVTKEQLQRKFSERYIDELLKEEVLKVVDGKVLIDFLNEQFENITASKTRLSEAGKRGAQAKKQATLKPPLSHPISDAEATLKQLDKIREDKIIGNNNKPLKGREHFEHLKSFFSKPYQQQTQEFKKLYTEKEYNDFGKFLKAMLNDFQEQLEQKFDKCLSIGEWKSIFKCAGYMRIKPAIIKTLGAAQGDRQNMAARIFTYTGEEFTDKAFKL